MSTIGYHTHVKFLRWPGSGVAGAAPPDCHNLCTHFAATSCIMHSWLQIRKTMKVFIPLSDEMIESMNGSESPVPYQVGLSLESGRQAQASGMVKIISVADELPVDHPLPTPAPQQGRR